MSDFGAWPAFSASRPRGLWQDAGRGSNLVYGASLLASLIGLVAALWHLSMGPEPEVLSFGLGLPASRKFPPRCARVVLSRHRQFWWRGRKPLRHRLRPARILAAEGAAVLPGLSRGDESGRAGGRCLFILVAWEFMSLSSWALVTANHARRKTPARASSILSWQASGPWRCCLRSGCSLGPMAATHSRRCAGIIRIRHGRLGAAACARSEPARRRASCRSTSGCRWRILLAPSHVSALMSGVMTKVAIYVSFESCFDLVGEPLWWTSLIVLALAAATAVIGILSALMQNDLKRLLAYSTVENVGIIFVGLGLALAFRGNHMELPAALAMTAALFHVLNHSIFKSLLFFGAGAVLTATGERNMESLGGLIHRMPRTAVHSSSAARRFRRCRRSQRLRVGMADVPGHPGRARPAAMGPAFMIPTVGALLALRPRLPRPASSRLMAWFFLGRPRTPQPSGAGGRSLLPCGHVRAGRALLHRRCVAGLFIDLLAPMVQSLVGGRIRCRRSCRGPRSCRLRTPAAPIMAS